MSVTTLNVASTSNTLIQTIQGSTGQTSLNVIGNVYASNAVTATTFYGNVSASNVIVTPATGVTGINVTGNVFVSNALTTTNVFANTITYSLDVLAQGPYLNPSTSNAGIITQWYSRLVNTISRPFWSVSNSPQVFQIPTSNVTGFTSPTLLSDGRVLFIANQQNYLGVFNPGTNQFSYVTGTGIAAYEYSGGIQIPDGRVVLIPSNGNKVGLLNPTSWALSTVSTGTSISNMHYGAVYEPTGNVIMTPANSSNVGIFNTNTGTYSRVAFATDGTFPIYHGSVLLPDGRVVFIPNTTSNVGIYTPSTATYSNVTVTVKGRYAGGCLMPDGNVFMVPNLVSSNACIYNPNVNTVSNVALNSIGGGGGGGGAVALPDGRIAVFPALNNTGTSFPIYNYRTGTVNTYTGASMYQNNQVPGGGTLVPDGRVIFSTALGIGVVNFETPAPREFCLHPFFNKF
jgi:streptogramin lyase